MHYSRMRGIQEATRFRLGYKGGALTMVSRPISKDPYVQTEK